jgi:hypothetical protein
VRIAAYFTGWLLALPGLLFAIAVLALNRVIVLANLFSIGWEMLIAFAYGLPLAGLAALVVCIFGFFRTGRAIGAGALLVAALGTLAVIFESTGAPKGVDEALFFAPTVVAAVLAGWLLQAETRAGPPAPVAVQPPR